MINTHIFSIADINLEWLQEVLNRNFGENSAEIEDLQITEFESSNSNTAIIKIKYKDNPSNNYPTSFFIKFCRQDDRFIVDSEYLYYTEDYKGLENAPLPKCLDAEFSKEKNSYHILLEDLSQTHYSNKDIPPTRQHTFNVTKELAKLHACRWTNKSTSLQNEIKISEQINKYIEHISNGLLPIIKSVKSEFTQESIDRIERIFQFHPQKMKERAKNTTGMTLIHGDPNPSNILSPNNPNGKTYIIDRQPFKWSLTHWLGVYDIAYMIVPFWAVNDRRSLEKDMIQHYHQSLVKFGVKDYSFENCLEDYKLCVAHGIYTAIEWGTNEKDIVNMKWLWQKQLKRSLTAFTDWKCDELLKT